MGKTLDWDLLRSFLAVARAGKLTNAARQLKLNHATLSRRITALERALDAKLFDRSLTGYVLTSAGQQLLVRAEEMEDSVFGVQTDFAIESADISGAVRIGSPDGFGTAFLAPIIQDLAFAHPRLAVELLAMPRTFSISRREADIAIGLSPPKQSRINARRLTDYELGLYGRAADHEKWATIRNVESLSDHLFVSYIDDLIFAPELDYVSAVARTVVPRICSSSIVAQAEVIATGGGIGILPCFLADRDPRLQRILPSSVRLTRTLWIMCHTDMLKQPRVKTTMSFIQRQVANYSSRFLP
ncbi:LysR family transcriptional regulator [Martelella sp. AMO21009]